MGQRIQTTDADTLRAETVNLPSDRNDPHNRIFRNLRMVINIHFTDLSIWNRRNGFKKSRSLQRFFLTGNKSVINLVEVGSLAPNEVMSEAKLA